MLRSLLIVSLTLITAAVSILVLYAYGAIPGLYRDHATLLFGKTPGSTVLGYSSGWTDHSTFLVFKADREWVDAAVAYEGLTLIGTKERWYCLRTPAAPWWFGTDKKKSGLCWEHKQPYGGMTLFHYDESSEYVYVHDFSS